MLPSPWFAVGTVVLFVAPAWHCEQSVTLCLAWLPVFGPLAAIAPAPEWHPVHPVVTVGPQTGVVTVPVPYTLA
jgi:hypothetical protein